MKNLIILVFIFFYAIQIQAQREQAIYAELGGAGLAYSINYDTRFNKGENGIGARIGIGTMNTNFTIPVQLNYLHGKGKHKLELGIGITSFLFSKRYENNQLVKRSIVSIPSGTLMYRYQDSAAHFLFRAGLSPIFAPGNRSPFAGPSKLFLLWPGISAGYKF